LLTAFCPSTNIILPILHCQVVLFEDLSNANKPIRTASLSGAIFENAFATATNGQAEYTGLTDAGWTRFDNYVQENKEARLDNNKRKFERDHLVWQKTQMDIQCDDWLADKRRRGRAAAREGIAQDTAEELAFDEAALFTDSEEEE